MRLLFSLAFLGLFSLACAAGKEEEGNDDSPGDEDADSDGDGLLDAEEAALGSDPAAADTDGDGYDDGAEVASNTDPLDADDKPYRAGWPIDACRDDIEATGTRRGDVIENFTFGDQFGETLSLHDFCNQVVLLVGAGFT